MRNALYDMKAPMGASGTGNNAKLVVLFGGEDEFHISKRSKIFEAWDDYKVYDENGHY